MKPSDETLFVPTAGNKVECIICHRKGYAFGRWQEACLRGHAQCARGCGKWMSVLPNGRARVHARCPRLQDVPA